MTPIRNPDVQPVLRIARLLLVHGQTTEGTRVAVEEMGRRLGRPLTLAARWGELAVLDEGAGTGLRVAAVPLAVDMGTVAAAETLLDGLRSGGIAGAEASEALAALERRPPVGLARFAAMAGLGAAGLSAVFGADDPATVALVGLSAGAGGLLRRALSRLGAPGRQPVPAAVRRGPAGRRDRGRGLGAAAAGRVEPRRRVPLHGAGAGAAFPQRHARPRPRAHRAPGRASCSRPWRRASSCRRCCSTGAALRTAGDPDDGVPSASWGMSSCGAIDPGRIEP